MTETPLDASHLLESLAGFATLDKGLVVVSGEDVPAANASAQALARHLEDCGAAAGFIGDRWSADILVRAVDRAWDGALVVMTAPFGEHTYSRLVEVLQSAEDWDIRPRFDSVLHAVVQLSPDEARAHVWRPAARD